MTIDLIWTCVILFCVENLIYAIWYYSTRESKYESTSVWFKKTKARFYTVAILGLIQLGLLFVIILGVIKYIWNIV